MLRAIEMPCGYSFVGLKNQAKWRRVPRFGGVVKGIFLPMKLPFDFDECEKHTLAEAKAAHPSLKFVIDLSHHCLSTYRDGVGDVFHAKLLLEVRAHSALAPPLGALLSPSRLSRGPAALS